MRRARVNVQRLLDGAARSDGFDGLSDQLAADLEELLGGRNVRRTIAVGVSDRPMMTPTAHGRTRRGFTGNGDWTMQVVTDPRRRHGAVTRRLVDQLVSEIHLAGGGRVDWWVYAPTRVDETMASEFGFRADRRLLQMRRALQRNGARTSPLVRSSQIATRRPG